MSKEEMQLSVPAADIPLWLLDRHKLPKDWGKKLKLVQTKYDGVLGAINAKSELSNIHAFLAKHKEQTHRLMQLKDWVELEQMLISSSEGKEKNIFGRYSSPIIKDVRLIVAMLKKDNLYLADIGKEITARIQFEIPGLRKQLSAFDKQAKDALAKAGEYERSAAEAIGRFNAECQNLGVPGKSLDTEILNLVNEVPHLFDKAVEKLKTDRMGKFIKFYEEYCKDLLEEPDSTVKRLQYLGYVQEHGDTITDLVVERMQGKPISDALLKREQRKYELYNNFAQACQDAVTKDFVVVEDTTKSNGKIEKEGEQAASEETLLSDYKLRDLLLNDLAEAEAFAMRKIQELKGAEQAIFMTYDQSKKATIIQESDNAEFLSGILDDIQAAHRMLTSKRLYMLLDLKHNPNSKERVKGNLERHLHLQEKYQREKKWHEDKNEEVSNEMKRCRESLQSEMKTVEELKTEAQKGIEEIFKCQITIT